MCVCVSALSVCLCLCVHACMGMLQHRCGGQRTTFGASSPFLLMWILSLNSDHKIWCHVSLPTVPQHWPHLLVHLLFLSLGTSLLAVLPCICYSFSASCFLIMLGEVFSSLGWFESTFSLCRHSLIQISCFRGRLYFYKSHTLFFKQGLSIYLWLAQNSLSRPGYLWTLPGSASWVLILKACMHYHVQ